MQSATSFVKRAASSLSAAAVPAVLALLAGLLYLRDLGRSSFFIDEAITVDNSRGGIHDVLHAVLLHETSPPPYTLLINGWIRLTGSHSEFTVRLPSALAGIGLVLAVWYLATLLADPPTAFLAALLTMSSPIVFEYAQQARVYVMLMLAATLSVIAAVKAVERSSARWLAVAGLACASTVSLHYIAWFVIGPLAAWIALRRDLPGRHRAAFCAGLVLTGLAWLPEFVDQFGRVPNGGLGPWADFTRDHVLRLLGEPLNGRAGFVYAGEVGTAVLFAPLAALALGRSAGILRHRCLILSLGAGPVVFLVALGATGKDIVFPRYATVAVPFLLLALAAATRALPGYLSRVFAFMALLPMLFALLAAGLPSGMYPDARGVVETIEANWEKSDLIFPVKLGVGEYVPLAYYAGERLPDETPGLAISNFTSEFVNGGVTRPLVPRSLTAAYARAVGNRGRVWVVAHYTGSPPKVAGLLPPGYRAGKVQDFIASISLRLVLAEPRASHGPAATEP